jgi:hypothetical protein
MRDGTWRERSLPPLPGSKHYREIVKTGCFTVSRCSYGWSCDYCPVTVDPIRQETKKTISNWKRAGRKTHGDK